MPGNPSLMTQIACSSSDYSVERFNDNGDVHPHFHQPTDTADTIDPDIVKSVARMSSPSPASWQMSREILTRRARLRPSGKSLCYSTSFDHRIPPGNRLHRLPSRAIALAELCAVGSENEQVRTYVLCERASSDRTFPKHAQSVRSDYSVEV
jgi:hypothetical protein